jgi:hypothetical protein
VKGIGTEVVEMKRLPDKPNF